MALKLDQHGFVADVNAAAETIFDNDVKIKDRRLFVRDPAARALLKEVIDQLRTSPRLNPLATEPIIVQRKNKMPVIVRIWPFDWAAHLPAQEVRALLTLNALGPKPGPPAAILAKTFRLTPAHSPLARSASLCSGNASRFGPRCVPPANEIGVPMRAIVAGVMSLRSAYASASPNAAHPHVIGHINNGLGFRSVEALTDDVQIFSQAIARKTDCFDGYCFRFASTQEIATFAASSSSSRFNSSSKNRRSEEAAVTFSGKRRRHSGKRRNLDA
jgi:hypothetical protein